MCIIIKPMGKDAYVLLTLLHILLFLRKKIGGPLIPYIPGNNAAECNVSNY